LLGAAGIVVELLGIVHGALALRDTRNPTTFTPTDPQLLQAMKDSTLAIHPTSNLWRAWLGFNLSHSLGVSGFGAALLWLSTEQAKLFADSIGLRVACVAIAASYVALSKVFWFRNPLVGTSIAFVLVAAAAVIA
jgi:hypothetical protein